MPLLFHKYLVDVIEVGVWKIDEDEQFFLDQLDLYQQEEEQLSQLKGRRRVEWLAVRHLLHIMSGRKRRGSCLKDEFGKPYLENSPFQISMSHTEKMASVIAGPIPVGIDIQKKVDKIDRIAAKFVSTQEFDLNPSPTIEWYHLIWGAKECMYKAYGRKRLDFRNNLRVDLDQEVKTKGKFSGQIYEGDHIHQEFHIGHHH